MAESPANHYLEKPFVRDQLEYLPAFEMLAYLEISSHKLEKSAQLLGVTLDVYGRNQRRLSPRAREMREQAIASLKQSIGEEAFTAAWEEGKKLTLKQATEVALGKPA